MKMHPDKTKHPMTSIPPSHCSNVYGTTKFGLQTQSHSTIVDRTAFKPIISKQEIADHIKTYGKFQSYPDRILNPSFWGMTLWELTADHIFNDYKLCPFHQIKSGVILYGHIAYVFTPIENNNIKSHLKILLQNKTLKNNILHARDTRLLVDYIQNESSRTIIPCVSTIQKNPQNQ